MYVQIKRSHSIHMLSIDTKSLKLLLFCKPLCSFNRCCTVIRYYRIEYYGWRRENFLKLGSQDANDHWAPPLLSVSWFAATPHKFSSYHSLEENEHLHHPFYSCCIHLSARLTITTTLGDWMVMRRQSRLSADFYWAKKEGSPNQLGEKCLHSGQKELFLVKSRNCLLSPLRISEFRDFHATPSFCARTQKMSL